MKQKRIVLLALILVSTISVGFTALQLLNVTPAPVDQDSPKWSTYDAEWKKVDSLEKKGLPKSALEIVMNIYHKAQLENNQPQLVKSVIFRMKFQSFTEEDEVKKMIIDLQHECSIAAFPARPVLHSLLAETYWKFYEDNRSRFLNRTETVDYKSDDILTWDLRKILAGTIDQYKLSLADEDSLKHTPVTVFDPIILKGKPDESRKLRPMLYDFLVHRAIDFYMNDETGLTQPADKFVIDSAIYLAAADKFARLALSTRDSRDMKFNATQLLQKEIQFHLGDDGPDALIDVDLKRLKFVYKQLTIPEKDALYIKALRSIADKYQRSAGAADALYEVATYYFNKGNTYKPGQTDSLKWYVKKADLLCDSVITLYPKTQGDNNCRYLQSMIHAKSLAFTVEKVNLRGLPFRAKVDYKNVNKIYLRIAKNDLAGNQTDDQNLYGEKLFDHYIHLPELQEWTQDLKIDGDYQPHAVEIKMPALQPGNYVIIASNNSAFSYDKNAVSYATTWVSNISYISRSAKSGGYDFYMLNRETGEQLKGVVANAWSLDYDYQLKKYQAKLTATYYSDDNGYFNLPPPASNDHNNVTMEFIKGDDRIYMNDSYYLSQRRDDQEWANVRTYFFLDRAIYRPGQTVYFKGIMIKSITEHSNVVTDNNIVTDKQTTVSFYNANNEKVSDLSLITNDYGTFNGSFTAPLAGLTGSMVIRNENGQISFRVEEYKRPKFEVHIQPVKESYRPGEKITVYGKAVSYSGANITDAEVSYRVVRGARIPEWYYYWRGFMPSSADQQIATGTTTTNDTGGFIISFPAIPDYSIAKESNPTFSYTISADVTDLNGETHSQSRGVMAAYKSLIINVGIPAEVNGDGKKDFLISTNNVSGEHVPAGGNITIYKLKEPLRLLRSRLWSQADEFSMTREEYEKNFPYDVYNNEDLIAKWDKESEMLKTDFDTKKDSMLHLAQINSWKQGTYMLEINAKDKYGEPVKNFRYFAMYSPKEKQLPVKKEDRFIIINSKAEPGDKVEMLVGTDDKDVRVLYEVERQQQIVSKQWLTLNEEQKLIELPIEEKDRGNISVHFIFIKHDRVYHHDQVITVPWTNKQLNISFETFRSKIKPGTNEEWKIKIKDKAGDKIMAEMVASLYDASLDAFAANNWYFNIYNSYYSSLSFGTNQQFSVVPSTVLSKGWNSQSQPSFRTYDQLNWFGLNMGYGRYSYRNVRAKGAAFKSIFGSDEMLSEQAASVKESKMPLTAPIELTSKTTEALADKGNTARMSDNGGQEKQTPETQNLSAITARTNLNETAFFYPQLNTNENGEVIISFTMPEALTRWKMLGFAHTKDLKYGQIEKELVTQKELMVEPNPPRFFREGDTISFPAKVTNLSDSDLTGTAELFLYDAISMKPLQLSSPSKHSFTVKKGQNASLSWNIVVPEGIGAITYKVAAQSGNFTDGEEQAIPVLTNRMLVTESLPLPVRSKQTKTFEFTKLLNSSSSTLRNYKLTLEYSSNPAWYAIQALPYMMEYPYECSEQIFSRYYANAIASHIANSSPRIKAVFDSWKSKSPDAFLSALEKNQELKSLMLEETPWVLDAKNESERKKCVGLLFDLNKMSSELNGTLLKLQLKQAPDGGWPWFDGGPDDRYISQYIVEGMGHLDHLGVKDVRSDAKTWNMVQKAVQYIDGKMNEDYNRLLMNNNKEELKRDHLGSETIHYLYARSYFKDIPVNEGYKTAFNYFLDQSKEYWLAANMYNKYLQGMIALALNRYNPSSDGVPMDIIRSLKENALHNDEMGMYWKSNNGGLYWSDAPIETQALMIEAFDEVAKDSIAVDELKTWLLKQKQTQDWKTTKATAEACYALLLRGANWLAEQSTAVITIGDTKITDAYIKEQGGSIEEGTGYFKTSWSGEEIKPSMAKVTVENKNSVVSWGALYWQYFEQLDKITPAATPLKMEKKLFLEQPSPTGPVITPITEKTKLKVGDRIKVRIEIRVDRNMEYVMMKDMRASGLEPENVLSIYKRQDNLGYYESTRDASTNFFFNFLPKGTYVFEYPLRIAQAGDFSNGITEIQCMYAPEFFSHSEGVRLHVK